MLFSEKKNAFLGNSPFEIPMVAYPLLRLMVPVAKKIGLPGWPEDVALLLCCCRIRDQFGDTHCPGKLVYYEPSQTCHPRVQSILLVF